MIVFELNILYFQFVFEMLSVTLCKIRGESCGVNAHLTCFLIVRSTLKKKKKKKSLWKSDFNIVLPTKRPRLSRFNFLSAVTLQRRLVCSQGVKFPAIYLLNQNG